MRPVILALALVFGIANAPTSLDQQMQALIDEGQAEEARKRAEAAAARGGAEGHDWLGWLHESGEGVGVDFALAEYHYRVAARAGDNHAAWRLGVLIDTGSIPGKLEEAVALFRAAADREYTNAIVSLAVMQATGRGTTEDFGAAMDNYMRAARVGESYGVRGVGIMLYLGQGVAADAEEAAAWFLVSAAMGNAEAEANLQAVFDQSPDGDFSAVGRRALAIAAELGVEVQITVEEEDTLAPTVS